MDELSTTIIYSEAAKTENSTTASESNLNSLNIDNGAPYSEPAGGNLNLYNFVMNVCINGPICLFGSFGNIMTIIDTS